MLAQVNEQLAGERGNLAQVLRQEFADRLAASEEENRDIRTELAELRARQRLELEQLTREKQAELEEVHGRWVQAGRGLGGRGRRAPPSRRGSGRHRGLLLGVTRLQPAPWPWPGKMPAVHVLGIPRGHATAGAPCVPPAWLNSVMCRKGGGRKMLMRAPHTQGTPATSGYLPVCHRHIGGDVVWGLRALTLLIVGFAGSGLGLAAGGTAPVISPSRGKDGTRMGWAGRRPLLLFSGWRPPAATLLCSEWQAGLRSGGGAPPNPSLCSLQGEGGPGKEGGGSEQPPETIRGGALLLTPGAGRGREGRGREGRGRVPALTTCTVGCRLQ